MRWISKICLLFAIVGSGPLSVFAQCCNDEGCGSACQCGCNSPENAAPAGPAGPMKFESHNVTFLSRLALSQMGVTQGNVLGNDCWGWTDSATGREFAIFGLTNGTAFVEITNPTQPIYLGTLPTAHGNAAWRDIKVYNSRAYIVADGSANSNHGVQVFNLKQLLTVRNPPATLTATARFTGIGRAHNIAINEKTGYAYVIGSPSLASAGGLIMLDLKKGAMPELAGVFSEDGYVHDTQVVTYSGPDTDYNGYFPGGTPSQFKGREIAFCCNEDTLTIVDVTDKTNPVMISRTGYPQAAYTHQGWLSEDHLFFYVNDELDETSIPTTNTRTHIWLVRKLSSPLYLGFSEGTERTIDHNLYVKGKYIYQANYTSGLRILGQTNPIRQNLEEVGFFDTYPADNAVSFNGAWSVYPYFPSGNIIVSDRQNGLFVLRFDE